MPLPVGFIPPCLPTIRRGGAEAAAAMPHFAPVREGLKWSGLRTARGNENSSYVGHARPGTLARRQLGHFI
jgi:hypothetical protein